MPPRMLDASLDLKNQDSLMRNRTMEHDMRG